MVRRRATARFPARSSAAADLEQGNPRTMDHVVGTKDLLTKWR